MRSKLLESDRRVGVHAADAAYLRAKLDAALEEKRRDRDASQELAARHSEVDTLKSKLDDALLRISELQEEAEREVW